MAFDFIIQDYYYYLFFIYLFILYEGWNFNSGNYLFTTDTK